MPICDKYNLTFDSFFAAVGEALNNERNKERAAIYERFMLALNGVFSTPRLQKKLVDAINDFHELNDGIEIYMQHHRRGDRPDPVFDVLVDARRERMQDALDVFNAFVYDDSGAGLPFDARKALEELILDLQPSMQSARSVFYKKLNAWLTPKSARRSANFSRRNNLDD